jgi:hypothetical protein
MRAPFCPECRSTEASVLCTLIASTVGDSKPD